MSYYDGNCMGCGRLLSFHSLRIMYVRYLTNVWCDLFISVLVSVLGFLGV